MAECRLDKFLSNRTSYSRSDIKKILKNGAVTVDGIAETDGNRRIDPDLHEIICEGKPVHGGTHIYLIMNKPRDVICATEDRNHKTVLDLLPEQFRIKGLFPAGRLDIDSTGLVLLTDDGALSHRMLSPKQHVGKVYLVRLARPFEENYLPALAEGLTLSDGTHCLPAQAFSLPDAHFCLIRLHEGKYHVVKRMFAALGNHVCHLHRIAVGGLLLPQNLSPGECLEIFHKEIDIMLNSDAFPVICEQIVSEFPSYLINAGQ